MVSKKINKNNYELNASKFVFVYFQQYIKSVGKDDENPDEICFKLGIASSSSGELQVKYMGNIQLHVHRDRSPSHLW